MQGQAPPDEDEIVLYVEQRNCQDCKLDQPLRTKHCKVCKRCVSTFDHHCPWLGNCVGEWNRRRFFMFVVYQTIEVSWAATVLSGFVSESFKHKHSDWFSYLQAHALPLLSLTISLFFTVLVGSLLPMHLYLA